MWSTHSRRIVPDQQPQKDEEQRDHRGRRYVIPSPDQTDRHTQVVRPDGLLSDMVNKTRAKDVARGLAENTVYLGKAA